jgi:hypothetical protein
MTGYVFLAALIAGWAWGVTCNHRTFRQRHRILVFIRDHEDWGRWRQFHTYYDLVPYGAHFWRLVFFRNPKYLYHFSLWDGLE